MKYLATSALALVLAASGVAAEQHTSDTNMSGMSTEELASMEGQLIRSRDITGGNVYTANAANDEGWSSDTEWDSVATDWNNIGEIEDLVLSKDGQIIGIVAEVGGFLDIADKHVVIAVNDLNLVAVDDATYAYVTRWNEEQLEQLPDVDEGFWD